MNERQKSKRSARDVGTLVIDASINAISWTLLESSTTFQTKRSSLKIRRIHEAPSVVHCQLCNTRFSLVNETKCLTETTGTAISN